MGQMPMKQRYVQPTSKGQVTLPVSIRRQLAITPNTLFAIVVWRGRVLLEPIVKASTQQQWETVVDFTELSPRGVVIDDVQQALKSWTKSKRR